MKCLAILTLSLAAAPAFASGPVIEYRCPQQIMTTQALASEAPGWRQSTEPAISKQGKRSRHNSEHNLSTVSFYEGVPEDLASLVPDNENEAGTRKVWDARWEFSKSESIWLACLYRQTSVVLSRQLAPGIKRCLVRFDRTKGIAVQKVWCEK